MVFSPKYSEKRLNCTTYFDLPDFLPYQMLTLALNAVVLFLSVGIVIYVRSNYMDMIGKLFPQLEEGNLGPALVIGVLLFVGVSLFNIVAVRRKVASIWMHKG